VEKEFPGHGIFFLQDYFLLLYALEQMKSFYFFDFEKSNDWILRGSIGSLVR
jgi:hypothetical protein